MSGFRKTCQWLRSRLRGRSRAAAVASLVLTAPLVAQSFQPVAATDFGTVAVGSAATPATLTFTATAAASVQSVAALTNGTANLDFTLGSQTCTAAPLTAGQTCTVKVSFTPSAPGLRSGAVVLRDATNRALATAFLEGVGQGAQIVFDPPTVSTLTSATPGATPGSFAASGVAVDGAGSMYFNDAAYARILRRTAAGQNSVVSLLNSSNVSDVVIDGAGVLYISAGAVVYRLVPGTNPVALPLSGNVLQEARGLAVDGQGNLYIADALGNDVLRMAPDGTTVVLAPTGLSLPLSQPSGLAVNHDTLYISDTTNNRVVAVNLSTLAATVPVSGLAYPLGLAVDAGGNLVIADTGRRQLVVAPASGASFQLSTPGVALQDPVFMSLLPNGNVVLADPQLGLVTINRSSGALAFPTATRVNRLDTADGALPFGVMNSGNVALQLTAPSSGSNPLISNAAFALTSAGTCPIVASAGTAAPLAVGQACTYTSTFTPSLVGANTGTATLSASTGGGGAVTGTVALSGTGLTNTASLTVAVSPSMTQPGTLNTVTVTALNGSSTPDATYRGTITLSSTDSTATFPAGTTYTFTAADAGVHTFQAPAGGVAFHATGSFTVSAQDANTRGTSNSVRVVYANGFAVSANPAVTQPGAPVSFTVTPTFNGVPATSYLGTVVFSSSDTTATFLGGTTYTFTAADNGTHTFTASSGVQFNQLGNFTVTATDGNFSGVSNPVQVVNADSFTLVVTPSVTSVGVPVGFTVTARLKGSVATNFTGTVTLSSSDATAVFVGGSTYTFTAADNGTHTFPASAGVQFNSGGTFTISATDGLLRATSNPVAVAAAVGFSVVASPASTTLGTPVGFTVAALLNNGATSTNYTGTVSLASTDPRAVFLSGSTYTFTAGDHGTHTFLPSGGVQFNSVGSFTITASSDTASGTSNPVAVNGNAALGLTSSANPALLGQTLTLTATVQASNGSPTGTVTWLDGTAPLGTATLSNGTAKLSIALQTTGTHTLTARYSGDATFPALASAPLAQVVGDFSIAVAAGSSGSASVLPGQAATFMVTVAPVGSTTLPTAVTMEVTGQPTGSTVTVQPATVAAGAPATNVAITIKPALYAGLRHDRRVPAGMTGRRTAEALLALMFLPVTGFVRRRRTAARLLVLVLLALPLGALTGCLSNAADGYFGNTPQTYNLVITANSGGITRSTTVSLTVQ